MDGWIQQKEEREQQKKNTQAAQVNDGTECRTEKHR